MSTEKEDKIISLLQEISNNTRIAKDNLYSIKDNIRFLFWIIFLSLVASVVVISMSMSGK
jgi:hypothetical protein